MLTIFFRAVILYTVSVAAVRLMGKRQIGQLQPYELVLAILIADLAAGPMSGAETPLAYGLVPIAALVIMHSAASLLGMKSPPFRRLLNGTARVQTIAQAGLSDRQVADFLHAQGVGNPRSVLLLALDSTGEAYLQTNAEGAQAVRAHMDVPVQQR